MHDFLQTLSFSPFALKNGSGTTAATAEPLRRLTQSFNELPAYRPAPRATTRRKLRARTNRKS